MSESLARSRVLESIGQIEHAFGTLAQPIPAPFAADWDRLKPDWKQVHGVACGEAIGPRSSLGEIDAVYTRVPGVPIAVVTADCVPILLARRDGAAVAAVHSGWRGTRARITRELFKRLGEVGRDWIAAIGPSIGPCCYEVSEELANDFAREFSGLGSGIAVPRHRYLDLPAIAAAELKMIGLSEVEIIRECTKCTLLSNETPKYRSYRREGSGTRQWSLIKIR